MRWAHLRAMLWLRWRLSRNQWRRGGQVNAIVSLIAALLGLSLAAVGGIAGVVLGALGLGEASPQTIMLVWDGLVGVFLFLWMIGIVTELQRSELIDLSKLLHLPVSLTEVFLLNYLSSFLSFSLAVALPLTLGLTAGLAVSRGAAMALLLPLSLGFFFMITAWTYCLRGWLASLMVNQRRRRAIVMGITLAFVLLAQLPNLATNLWGGHIHHETKPAHPGQPERAVGPQGPKVQVGPVLVAAHRYVPVLWLPQGARSLAERNIWPALAGVAGMAALGALGLRRAYQSTVRFYRGGNEKKLIRKAPTAPDHRVRGRSLVERELPLVPAEAAALALANLRSMTRAPEVKMSLFLNVFMLAVIGGGMLMRGPGKLPGSAQFFVVSGAVLVTFVGMMQVLCNQFGFDRDGFRSLVLVPALRKHVLLGKNLSMLPLGLGMFLVFLVLLTVLARLSLFAIAAGCLQFLAAFLGLSALGNLASILVPYRIAAGSLKPTKTKATTVLMIMAVQMTAPLAMAPVALPAVIGWLCQHLGWMPAGPATVACSVLLVMAAAPLYWLTLQPLGDLLQRREKKILEVVTQEVE